MEMPLRATLKLLVACALIAGTPSVQLILLMVFNLSMLIYTAYYTPSNNRVTNYLNGFIYLAFIGL